MFGIFLRRKTYKATFFISIIGLALGLASLIVITLYLNYELNYDRWSPELKNVYGVGTLDGSDKKEKWSYYCDTRTAFYLKSGLPQVKALTMISRSWWGNEIAVTADNNSFSESKMLDCDSAFFDVFPYRFVAGNSKTALKNPNTIVVSESQAKKWFGNTEVIGRSVSLKRWNEDILTSYQIEGVVALPESPSTISFSAVFHSGNMDKLPSGIGSTAYAQIFISLYPGTDVEKMAGYANSIYSTEMEKLNERRSSHNMFVKGKTSSTSLRIQPLEDVHVYPLEGKSVPEKAAPLIGLSVLLLLLAITNFTNLAVAESFSRIKSISVKKILGASRIHLIGEILGEIAVKCLTAMILAMIMSVLLLPFINEIFNISISLKENIDLFVFLLQLSVIFLVTCLLAGIYPCIFLTNFSPLGAFRDENGSMTRRQIIGNALIVLQFFITVIFIISLAIMNKQIGYMQDSDPGFKPIGLLHIESSANPRMIEELQQIPGVQYAGVSSQKTNEQDVFTFDASYEGQSGKLNLITVGYETLNALNVQLQAGRLFSKDYGLDSLNTIILNKTAADILGKDILGKTIYTGKERLPMVVVGIIKDYNYHGFEQKIAPAVYAVNTNIGVANMNHVLVRINGHEKDVIERIKEIWGRYYLAYPLKYTYLDEEFGQLNADYERLQNIFFIFSVVSLLLALIGLFALTTFMIRQRLKEFSIRKTLGASSVIILTMISKKYLKLVVVSNILAYPVVLLLAKDWLNKFAYRIDVPYGAFLLTTVLSLLATGITLAIQIGSISRVNPVKYLKGS